MGTTFSKTMDPLFSALRSRSLPLCKEAIEAIQQVTQSIKDAVVHIADSDKPLCLTTDASSMAIGAILSQEGRPVAFISKRLTSSQRCWSPAELKGFVVVSACQQFRHYLAGKPFSTKAFLPRIFCDQHSFVQALNSSSTKQIKNAKFARWRLELSEFDFTKHHLPGILNTVADALTCGTSTVTVDKSFQLFSYVTLNMVILALTICFNF